ncbi:MAG TPA: GGDEF domain-containing protein [Methyloversatilis sp.]
MENQQGSCAGVPASPPDDNPDTPTAQLPPGRRQAAAGRLLLGTDTNQRLRISRALTSMLVFVVCIGLAEYAMRFGMASTSAIRLLQAGTAVWMIVVYAALRSGWNLRLADPAMTLPQIMGAEAWVTVSYLMFAPVRGALLMLLSLTLVFGIFNLDARGRRICNSFALGAIGLGMATMATLYPDSFPPHIELIHFVLVATILPVVSMLGAQLGNIRQRLRLQRNELEQALERIRELATRDDLTGLYNRRYMQERLMQQINGEQRSGGRFSLCLADLDHFKRINDTHGHGVGDLVLRQFADIARTCLRESDTLARWGGEEFLVLLPDTGAGQATQSMERLRAAVAGSALHGMPGVKVTFSAGVIEYRSGETAEQAVERADRALYRAKAEGRNRIVAD